MPITAVRNPVWFDADKTMLDVEISLDNGATFHPYTAHPDSEIYRDILAGKYGAIGARQPVAPTADSLAFYAQVAARRNMERGISVTVGNQVVQVDTHPAAIAAISRNLQLGSLNPSQTFNWVQSSAAITLNVAQMQTVAKAAYSYEQACWSALADVSNKIATGAITTQAQVDSPEYWPSSNF